jgi:hypothetical protein
MAGSRRRLLAASASVIVSALMGIITNLITGNRSMGLIAGGALLALLVVIAVILAAAEASAEDRSQDRAADHQEPHPFRLFKQRARASHGSTIIQAHGNVVFSQPRPADEKEVS